MVTTTVGSPVGIVGDDANGRIVAADYNGDRVDSVSGIDGIFDLALSDDGTALYAAARPTGRVLDGFFIGPS